VIDSADLSDEELATIQGVVRDGALLLDQDVPDWATKVPTDERFDMQSEDRDILGWVYGSFQRGMDALGVDSADLYGFDFPDVQVPNSEETPMEILIEDDSIIEQGENNVWAALREAWTDEIQNRITRKSSGQEK
jgi:hypothetical protein